MTRYAVGDLQGCLSPLKCLLKDVSFDSDKDQLWITGDLINRGPDSLKTLHYVNKLGDCARIVLGNHDLHFLAVAVGATTPGSSDTFNEILTAPDCEELVDWLRHQPLFYSDPSDDYHMVHAGIPPNWSIKKTRRLAREVEDILRSNGFEKFLSKMYGNFPTKWDNGLQGMARARVITNYLTRMRFCSIDGELEFNNKLATIEKAGFAPWFSYHDRKTKHDQIIFGHWAALEGQTNTKNVFALDTGCVWGRSMTLMNLENRQLHHCHC